MNSGPLDADVAHMRRAIALAMRGRGNVEPNPMVGCVLVKGGRVIGEGFHERVGQNHAEPNALANCTEDPRGATAYVTLEPCCHTNKRTPPCCPRLIGAGIRRVVVGALDPNPAVDGNGVAALRAAGVEVVTGVLERECKQLIAPFLAGTKCKAPYVTLKWAQTADGRVAGPGGARLQISNSASTRVVHELRARCDAILVGVNTVVADDPRLTPRDVGPSRLHTRIVLDHDLRLPLESQLVRTAKELDVAVYTSRDGYATTAPERIRGLLAAGVHVIVKERGIHGVMRLPEILHDIGERDVTHLLVEPGPTLAAGFFEANAADRLWVIESPMRVGDESAPAAAAVPGDFVPVGKVDLGGDALTEYLNPQSPAYFASEASADFLLASSHCERSASRTSGLS